MKVNIECSGFYLKNVFINSYASDLNHLNAGYFFSEWCRQRTIKRNSILINYRDLLTSGCKFVPLFPFRIDPAAECRYPQINFRDPRETSLGRHLLAR